MIPKVQAVRRDPSSLTVQVIYSDQTIETYMDGFSRLFDIKIGLTKSQVHQIVNLSKTTIKTGTANTSANTSANNSNANNLSSKTSGGSVFVGAHLDPQTFDPLRARVEAAGAYMNSPWATVTVPDLSAQAKSKATSRSLASDTLGTASHTSAPWDDPLSNQTNENIVACMDIPEWRPDVRPDDYIVPNKIYYHDRFPSKTFCSIIDGAIEVLNKHKGINITKISFFNTITGEFQLVIKGRSPHDKNFSKTLEVILNQRAFERFSHEIDKYAKLKAKWDTNTYIKMRIAYLLYRGMMLGDSNAKDVKLDIFKIVGSNTRPDFTL